MRAVLTRVKSASVSVDGKTIGSIGPGFLILLGITHDDTEAQAVKLAATAARAAARTFWPPPGPRWPSPCMKSSCPCAGKRASIPKPASSAPRCWWNPSTTDL